MEKQLLARGQATIQTLNDAYNILHKNRAIPQKKVYPRLSLQIVRMSKPS